MMYQMGTSDQLTPYKLPETTVTRFSGAYSPFIKAIHKSIGGTVNIYDDNFGKKKVPTNKTRAYVKEKKEREQKHMDQAMKGAFETMGVMGIIPFYKDAKDYIGRNDFY